MGAIDIVIPAIDPGIAAVTGWEAERIAGMDTRLLIIHDVQHEGFTRTVNTGLRAFLSGFSDAVVILNDDVRFPTDGWLRQLWGTMQMHGRAGFVGPSGNCRTHPVNTGKPKWADGRYRPAVEVSHHPYFCTLLRRQMLEEVGLLDERLIFYDSDVLHQWKAHRYNWRTYWNPMVYVEHDVSGWTKRDPEKDDLRKAWREHDVAMSQQIQGEVEWWAVKHG